MHVLLEVCCGSAEDAAIAAAAGAHRLELNAALSLGGLTPSIGTLLLAKKANLPCIAMVRPREGGFCYSETEFETMLLDTESLLLAGADGIAFGILHADGTVDAARCRQMIELIGTKEAVFHRAFDVTPDWRAALDTLCALGIRRVLTSGQKPDAIEGVAAVKEMIAYAADRIEVLPGAGIRPHNVRALLEEAGCTQVHASLRTAREDASCSQNVAIHFSGGVAASERMVSVTDARQVRELLSIING